MKTGIMGSHMKVTAFFVYLLIGYCSYAQDAKKIKLYDPEDKAEVAITNAITEAKKTGKHVLLQVGGNWCSWCIRFHEYVAKDAGLDSLMKANYVVYRLNYSKENYNVRLMRKYRYPQRFGFPVFLILDGDGNLIHTQNSWYLEDGKTSYDQGKIKSFFTEWGPKAFDPSQYREQ